MARSHQELCERAVMWLRNTKRCAPVLSGIASTREIPDAIGWGSGGSIVVEAKTSLSDFYADQKKYTRWHRPGYGGYPIPSNGRTKGLRENGYFEVQLPRMGDYRFYLCEQGILSEELVAKIAPDHGLIFNDGRKMTVALKAPRRENCPNKDAEIRLLRFALIHVKDNLLKRGCSVDLNTLTKFFGQDGITFPVSKGV